MSKLLARAFHEAVSVEKLGELYKSDSAQLFGGTTVGHCPKCRRQFAVFFPASDDPHNLDYLKQIEKMIGDDCREEKHVAEISLTFG